MILVGPLNPSASATVTRIAVEHAMSKSTFETAEDAGIDAGLIPIVADPGDGVVLQQETQHVSDNLDWNSRKLNQKFIRLEQRVLAQKATQDEVAHYHELKRDRNGTIFADRYIRDYAEIQRLRKLTEKLTEIQRYLRPIRL